MVNFLKSERDRFPRRAPSSLSMRSRGQGAHGVKAPGVGSVRRSIAVADWVFSLGFAMLPPSAALAELLTGRCIASEPCGFDHVCQRAGTFSLHHLE